MSNERSPVKSRTQNPSRDDVLEVVELLHASEMDRLDFPKELGESGRLTLDWKAMQANAMRPTPFESMSKMPFGVWSQALLAFLTPLASVGLCIVLFTMALRTGDATWWITAIGVAIMAVLMTFLATGFFFLGGGFLELAIKLKEVSETKGAHRAPKYGFTGPRVAVPSLASLGLILVSLGAAHLLRLQEASGLPGREISPRVMSPHDALAIRELMERPTAQWRAIDERLSTNARGVWAEYQGEIAYACRLYETAAEDGYELGKLNYLMCAGELDNGAKFSLELPILESGYTNAVEVVVPQENAIEESAAESDDAEEGPSLEDSTVDSTTDSGAQE